MNQFGGPTLADTLLHNPDRRKVQVLEARVAELEQCLRHTRCLVSQAAANKGFADEDTIRELFTNNGAITRLVPLRAEDRSRTSEMVDVSHHTVIHEGFTDT